MCFHLFVFPDMVLYPEGNTVNIDHHENVYYILTPLVISHPLFKCNEFFISSHVVVEYLKLSI